MIEAFAGSNGQHKRAGTKTNSKDVRDPAFALSRTSLPRVASGPTNDAPRAIGLSYRLTYAFHLPQRHVRWACGPVQQEKGNGKLTSPSGRESKSYTNQITAPSPSNQQPFNSFWTILPLSINIFPYCPLIKPSSARFDGRDRVSVARAP